MRILFVFIPLFLVFSQVASAHTTRENELAMVNFDNQNQESSENDTTDNEDEEIVFISANCSPALSAIEPEEAIYLHINHLKSHFFFSLWRPPRY